MLSQCTPLNLILQKVLFSTFVFWKEGNFRRNLKRFWCAPPSFLILMTFKVIFEINFPMSHNLSFRRGYIYRFMVEKIEELFQFFPLVIG